MYVYTNNTKANDYNYIDILLSCQNLSHANYALARICYIF